MARHAHKLHVLWLLWLCNDRQIENFPSLAESPLLAHSQIYRVCHSWNL